MYQEVTFGLENIPKTIFWDLGGLIFVPREEIMFFS